MGGLRVVTAESVAGRIDWRTVAGAIEAGHRLPRARITDQLLQRGADHLLSRAAWIDGLGLGVKSMGYFPGNRDKGQPSAQGAMLLFDDATGAPVAVLDGALVTYWKTAGDSVLGARLLARPDSRRLLVVGSGTVGESLVHAYREIFPGLGPVAIWSRTAAKADALVERLRRQGIAATAERDLRAAARAADIVASATASHDPVLQGAWIGPGTHVDLIGAFTPAMREADDELMRKARLFVDSRETTIRHIGELATPIASGAISEADVLADLYDLADGRPGRRGADEITLFKNGGGAHLDLMTAHALIRAAAVGGTPSA
jgi:ornithine cyclodeaminase